MAGPFNELILKLKVKSKMTNHTKIGKFEGYCRLFHCFFFGNKSTVRLSRCQDVFGRMLTKNVCRDCF